MREPATDGHVYNIGVWKGCNYKTIYDEHPEYCDWIIETMKDNPVGSHPELRHLGKYILQRRSEPASTKVEAPSAQASSSAAAAGGKSQGKTGGHNKYRDLKWGFPQNLPLKEGVQYFPLGWHGAPAAAASEAAELSNLRKEIEALKQAQSRPSKREADCSKSMGVDQHNDPNGDMPGLLRSLLSRLDTLERAQNPQTLRESSDQGWVKPKTERASKSPRRPTLVTEGTPVIDLTLNDDL